MGAPVFWKGKYFITQRNGIRRTSKSKYCTGGKTITLLPLPAQKKFKRRPAKPETSKPRMVRAAQAAPRPKFGLTSENDALSHSRGRSKITCKFRLMLCRVSIIP